MYQIVTSSHKQFLKSIKFTESGSLETKMLFDELRYFSDPWTSLVMDEFKKEKTSNAPDFGFKSCLDIERGV